MTAAAGVDVAGVNVVVVIVVVGGAVAVAAGNAILCSAAFAIYETNCS